MKIILSRKGFDSAAGGCASFIIDNKLISLPIPDNNSHKSYNNVTIFDHNIGELLKKSNITPKLKRREIFTCHLDPDIEKGVFGQCAAAAKHLQNQGVTVGDLFLFFGWFREFDIENNKFNCLDKKGKHCIFAYLKIGKILDLNKPQDKKEALALYSYHPHLAYNSSYYEKNNLLYIADNTLLEQSNIKGYGRLKYTESTTLTKPNENKSIWKLPRCFYQNGIKWGSTRLN